jgi:uncharacterized protein (DUF4415 family)
MTKSKPGIKSDLKRVDAHIVQAHEYEDAPELTDEQLASAEVSVGVRRPGRPKADVTKVPVSLRLDADLVAAFKATGEGWQTRMNTALRSAVGTTRSGTLRKVYGDHFLDGRIRSIDGKLDSRKRSPGSPKPKRA